MKNEEERNKTSNKKWGSSLAAYDRGLSLHGPGFKSRLPRQLTFNTFLHKYKIKPT